MGTIYEKVPAEVRNLVETVLTHHHQELMTAHITLNILFAFSYDKDGEPLPAKKIRGHQALAWTSVTSLQARARGLPDAKIVIDRCFGWERLAESRRTALIDHELTHLALVFDKDGDMKEDDLGRPKLQLRHHDWELTGFAEVAERHGEAAVEVHEMVRWEEAYGQYALFPLKGTTEVKVNGPAAGAK